MVPINSSIPLGVRTPEAAPPLQSANQLMMLQEGAQRQQIQQQQAQALQLENQQRAATLQSQQKIQKAWVDANGDLEQTATLARQYGALPADVLALNEKVVEQQKNRALAGKATLENNITRLQQLGAQAKSLMNMEDENTRSAAWSAARQNSIKNGFATEADLPADYPGLKWLQQESTKGLTSQQIDEGALKIAQTQEAQARVPSVRAESTDKEISSFLKTTPNNQADWTKQWNALSDAAKARITAIYSPETVTSLQRGQVPAQDRPKYDIELMQAAAMAKMNPQTLRAQVDSVIDPGKYPQQNARAKAAAANALSNGLGMAGVQAAIKDAGDSVQMIERETNPAVIQAGVSKAVQTQKALNSSSNAALANVPPHLVAPATADYTKVSNEYADAVASANDIRDVIDLARAGNKVAYAYEPTMGVLSINTGQGVKRVNMPEIKSYGGAGSAWDRITGYLGKQVSGASIPKDVLDDMEALHGQLTTEATDKYNNKVKVVNQAYGASYKPASIAPKAGTPPLPANPEKGKIYRNGKGQNVRVVEVNPANPAQFKTEVVNQ